MDIESLRTYCLSFPGATEIVQWEYDLLFKVGEKMFVAVGLPSPHGMSIKCDAATFDELIEREGIIPAPYLAKHKWVKLENLNVLPAKELKARIAESYRLVFEKLPKKLQASITASAG